MGAVEENFALRWINYPFFWDDDNKIICFSWD